MRVVLLRDETRPSCSVGLETGYCLDSGVAKEGLLPERKTGLSTTLKPRGTDTTSPREDMLQTHAVLSCCREATGWGSACNGLILLDGSGVMKIRSRVEDALEPRRRAASPSLPCPCISPSFARRYSSPAEPTSRVHCCVTAATAATRRAPQPATVTVMSSSQPRALTARQEHRLITYLDMQFLEISRGFNKRCVSHALVIQRVLTLLCNCSAHPSSSVPTLDAYLKACHPLMSLILCAGSYCCWRSFV